jgi:hypothetical protein
MQGPKEENKENHQLNESQFNESQPSDTTNIMDGSKDQS